MAQGDDGPIYWYTPVLRCLIPIEGIHVSRSLQRKLRKTRVLAAGEPVPSDDSGFVVTFDRAFSEVMRACQRPGENWISEEMINVYTAIHGEGWAHSCEVWQAGQLVGGVYGVAIGACFCGESKFHRATDASKVALLHLVKHLQGLGFEIFDAQFINDHTQSLGAYEIPQEEYVRRLKRVVRKTTSWS